MAKSRSIGGIYASLSLRDKGFHDGIKKAKLSLQQIRDGARGGLVNKDRETGGFDWKPGIAAVGGFTAGIGGAAAAFIGLTAAMRGVVEAYAPFDSMVRGLKVLDGTAAATSARLEKLRDVAKTPGLSFDEVVKGDIRLRSAGFSAETSEKALKGFGNALAAAGGSSEDLSGIILALGQISAKGKVSAEEINQLAERLPQIRVLMESAFGTADTEKIQKMGIDSKKFIADIINELEKLPRATGGARNDLDNYSDSWSALKSQAAEYGIFIAGPWIKEITRTFTQARKDLGFFKNLFGVKTPGLEGKDGKTEEERVAENEAAAKLKIEQERILAENKVWNENLMFHQRLQEERTAFLKEESEKRAKIEEETSKSRAQALMLYNEDSGIISAKLSGDKDRIKALEREKAIREKIADLVSSGFSEKEARRPAEAMVDALIKFESRDNKIDVAPREVNSHQSNGRSMDAVPNMSRHVETTNSILATIRDILKNTQTQGIGNW